MAVLENPKHEAFASFLARGVKQPKAYVQAGYTHSPPSASRLAGSLAIRTRVDELKKEMHQKIVVAMKTPNMETFESLREMGLTMEWVADAYKGIYEEALLAGQYAPANTAVQNIQKLIEIENNGKPDVEHAIRPKIAIQEVTAMLTEIRRIAEAGQPEVIEINPLERQKVMNPMQFIEDIIDDNA